MNTHDYRKIQYVFSRQRLGFVLYIEKVLLLVEVVFWSPADAFSVLRSEFVSLELVIFFS